MKKSFIAALAILGTLITVIGYGYKHRYAASIGIIGGADGPTAVFLAGKTGVPLYVGTALLVIAVAVLILRAVKGAWK